MKFRYPAGRSWFKGNTHIHSTASDGGKSFRQLARMYARHGYQFLFRTDHWVSSHVQQDSTPYPLLWLDGVELDGSDTVGASYHVVCLGSFSGLTREMGFPAALEAARSQGGILILAHPEWTGNSIEDALRWKFHGVETYNYVCRWLNGKGESFFHWNKMLEREPRTLAFAADDTHGSKAHPGWDGGWIMINAPELSREAVMTSLRDGAYYSTQGPEFLSLEQQGSRLLLRTSPVRFVRLVGPAWTGQRLGSFRGPLLTEATFDLPLDWPYAYAEIEDTRGRRAWTNSLLLPEAS